jgi:hypothetical protein
VITLPGEPAPNFDPKHTDVNETTLSIEVVDYPKPGRYDLTLTCDKSPRPRARVNPGSPPEKPADRTPDIGSIVIRKKGSDPLHPRSITPFSDPVSLLCPQPQSSLWRVRAVNLSRGAPLS